MSNLNPDDLCAICETRRDEHGDKNHKFSTDGILIQVKPGDNPKSAPPTNPNNPLNRDPLTPVILRLVERMIQAGLLEGDDLQYIFGGGDAGTRGSANGGAEEDNTTKGPE